MHQVDPSVLDMACGGGCGRFRIFIGQRSTIQLLLNIFTPFNLSMPRQTSSHFLITRSGNDTNGMYTYTCSQNGHYGLKFVIRQVCGLRRVKCR